MRKLLTFLIALVTIVFGVSASAQMSLTGAGGTKAPSAPSKSYTFLNAYDWQVGTNTTTINFNVTMTGTAGRLIVANASQNFSITSVVYDPSGANVSLTQDSQLTNGNFFAWFSGNVPAASGVKVVTVTYSGNVTFNSQSAAFWLATGLTTGFDSAVLSTSITVNSGDFLFAINYSSAANNWTANSTSPPTGNRLSNTSTFGSAQLSASADWTTPTLGTFNASGGALSNGVATYK